MADLNMKFYNGEDLYSDGDVEEVMLGIAEKGTAFEDIPDDWVCPTCGVGKDEFKPE